MNKIIIIDYGVGNIASLKNAFDFLHIPVVLSADHEEIAEADKIILPGVGAFAHAMDKLREKKLAGILKKKANSGIPLLGICLGMQLLFDKSYELGEWQGLSLLPGSVRKLENVAKIPHMGWNRVFLKSESPIFKDLSMNSYFYFVHSYYCEPLEINRTIGECEYGKSFCAAVQKDNIYGVQFHPEKSQKDGLSLLKNFAEL